jgi:2-C-methyl-D-erythritol 4-phosphate cytidylyltransferase/2-C-methyl-D-erythritol 2,4-cyclodiphosphate synthase
MGNLSDRAINLKQISKTVVNKGGTVTHFAEPRKRHRMTITALIVAAGRGARSGEAIPKQYVSHRGQAILAHTIKCFLDHDSIDDVVVVIHPDDEEHYVRAMAELMAPVFVYGGATRQISVRAGLEYLVEAGRPDKVLIHDAARPFVAEELINRVIAGLDKVDAVLPVLPLTDTIKQLDGNIVGQTLDRDSLGAAQTPQGFRFTPILAAHQHSNDGATDDAAIAENAGMTVHVVAGDPANIKITNPADFELLRLREASDCQVRTGTGFDVHRVGGGSGVILCGVDIPHHGSLIGHSDADVALHALTDALLGAIGAGDIGRHFPPSDPQWSGVNSRVFVDHAVSLVESCGGVINNVDMTIICEAPKITPHAPALIQSVASMLGVDNDRVSIKATTTEQLGVTGDGSGIAVQALVTIQMPSSTAED